MKRSTNKNGKKGTPVKNSGRKLLSGKKQNKTVPLEKVNNNFPIIGIGASAGGLAALETFFSNIPADKLTGMAFIIVQHLAPDHKSILNELIKKYTTMQVFEVTDGITVKPDCVYIIPPNHDMAFLNGNLQLFELESPRGKRLSIDFFFRSLAQDLHQRAICIILSGTGSDGTIGAKAIKEEGGLVIAQNPESTEYDGMPRSIIATGIVDFILTPEEMPERLMTYLKHSYIKSDINNAPETGIEIDYLQKIFVLLRSKTGHDFSQYKPNTITRRIERRMAVNQIEKYEFYLKYMQNTPGEIDYLFNDLLIGVTSFFRDKEAFKLLEKIVIPKLFEDKTENSLIRVWVPGCSTGDEAYSIAILLHEIKNKLNKSFRLQVFATDLDDNAIQQARSGLFPSGIKNDIEPARLSRYFIKEKESDTYRIQKEIRDILIFSKHDIIKDPPFSNLDLISCRNMLIYFGAELQKKIIPFFHYALKKKGYLFLGTSETIGDFINLFSVIDIKAKIYKLKEDSKILKKSGIPDYLPGTGKGKENLNVTAGKKSETKIISSLKDIAEKELLNQHTPACVFVNKSGDIKYLHGRTGLYLEPAPGETGMNVIKMAREGLKHKLISALQKVVVNSKTDYIPGLNVKTNGNYSIINLTVKKIIIDAAEHNNEELFMIIFQPVENIKVSKITGKKESKNTKKVKLPSISEIEILKNELNEKELYLQNTLDAMETSNEELKSINEELQSVNEEFQSTNEELETSREELQSVNEELSTVNSELQQKVADLSRSNNDMNNLLAGTDIGTIFVDNDLLIQRFTPAVTKNINLIATDIGRPISHIASNIVDYSSLVADMKSVLDTLIPKEIEVQSEKGEWYALRIRPYRTTDNMIEGLVITFFDFTEIKMARDSMNQSKVIRHLATVVQDSRDAIIARDLSGRIITWNRAAERMYGWSENEALLKNVSDLIPENLRKDELSITKSLINANAIKPYKTQRVTKNDSIVDIMITISVLINDGGDIYAITSTERIIENNSIN